MDHVDHLIHAFQLALRMHAIRALKKEKALPVWIVIRGNLDLE